MATNGRSGGRPAVRKRGLVAIGGLAMLVVAASGTAPAHADPALAYASYLGGTSDEADALGNGDVDVAVDRFGNVYIAGTTRSADFPTTPGVESTFLGGLDIFVTKLSPTGDVVYSTFVGGPCDDIERDLAIDSDGDAYITGRGNGGVCADDVPPGALVAKLDENGAVIYEIILGASTGDTSVGEAIAVGEVGQAYVTGVTQSTSHDFPVTDGVYRTQDCGGVGGDVFVTKLTKNPRLSFSTFLCGSGDEVPTGIAFGTDGSVYVAGMTLSPDFTTVNPLQAGPRGVLDSPTGFVAKLSWSGDQLLWSTYLGGSHDDEIRDLAIDGQDAVYVAGETQSEDFPTTYGALQEHAGSRACPSCTDAFVTKIDASGSLAYSTYLYGELDDGAYGIAVDGAGDAWVVGTTTSSYFPIVGAFQPRNRGLADAFVAELAPDGSRLLASSYLGGSAQGPSPVTGWDKGTDVALGGNGDVYVGGYTLSSDLPTTDDALQHDLAPGVCADQQTPCGDAFFARLVAGGPAPLPDVSVTVTPTHAEPGDTLTATWTGLPAPALGDQLQLQPLGALGAQLGDLSAWWPATGEAAGTEPLTLPQDLANDSYEVRLLSRNPVSGKIEVMARSEPIRIGVTTTTTTSTSTTTVPPPTTVPCASDSECHDDDPCTDDACVLGLGCVSTPTVGPASLSCTCRRAEPDVCTRDLVPSAVGRRKQRLCNLAVDGNWSPKRLRTAAKRIAGAMRIVARFRNKRKVSADCADALTADLADARDRAERLLAPGGS